MEDTGGSGGPTGKHVDGGGDGVEIVVPGDDFRRILMPLVIRMHDDSSCLYKQDFSAKAYGYKMGFRIDNDTEGGDHYLPCCIEHTHKALCWSGFGCGLSNLICRRKLSCKYDIQKAFPLKKENKYQQNVRVTYICYDTMHR